MFLKIIIFILIVFFVFWWLLKRKTSKQKKLKDIKKFIQSLLLHESGSLITLRFKEFFLKIQLIEDISLNNEQRVLFNIPIDKLSPQKIKLVVDYLDKMEISGEKSEKKKLISAEIFQKHEEDFKKTINFTETVLRAFGVKDEDSMNFNFYGRANLEKLKAYDKQKTANQGRTELTGCNNKK